MSRENDPLNLLEECKAQLAAAKAKVEDLKAQQAAMEKKLNEETMLYVEAKNQQTMRLNLKKTKKAHYPSMCGLLPIVYCWEVEEGREGRP